MASSNRKGPRGEAADASLMEANAAGFATPTAVIMSLAIALTATATTLATVAALHRARYDLARTQNEAALDGAQALAAATVMHSADAGVMRWRLTLPWRTLTQRRAELDAVDAAAEPEAIKLSLASAAALGDAVFQKLGVADPSALRMRLGELGATKMAPFAAVRDADPSPLWRRCAGAIVSAFGQAKTLFVQPPGAPVAGEAFGHAGQVWRISVVSDDGWSDERVVMFTGDGLHPTAIMERRFTRITRSPEPCDVILRGAGQ